MLVRRMVDGIADDADAAASVTPDVCDSCCRFPVPAGPELNPVVASRIYVAISRPLFGDTRSAEQQVLTHQVLEFARQRLRREDLADVESNGGSHTGAKRSLPGACRPGLRPAVRWVNRLPSLRRTRTRIGLTGWNSRYGLGHVNRDIARHLNVTSWLAPFMRQPGENLSVCRYVPRDVSDRELKAWLRRVDALLFVEQPPFPRLLKLARRQRIPVICVALWEWIRPGLEWVNDIDLMLCPTRYADELLGRWQARFGFRWERQRIEWPIDISRFRFRLRSECKRFVFIGGSGGCRARRMETNELIRRKGLAVMLRAAELLPEFDFLVYSQEPIARRTRNVTVRGFTANNQDLYRDGDVCVQPSYWEGLGLPLLECQASGLPLVTTDAAPMNEHRPLATIPVDRSTVGRLPGGQVIPIPEIDPEKLAEVLSSLKSRSIVDASRHAFDFVDRTHSWLKSADPIRMTLSNFVQSHDRSKTAQ